MRAAIAILNRKQYFLQETCNPTQVIQSNKQSEPYVLVVGTPSNPVQAFLAVDRQLLTEVDILDCPLAFMTAFFVFNICYSKGCFNFCTALEIVLLNVKHSKPNTTVSNFMSRISA